MSTATLETPTLTLAEMEKRIVRYGELKPCKTAFIDAHTPGSDQKENFTIIGGGVSESPDQHVHIKETPGFNIGAAGQPQEVKPMPPLTDEELKAFPEPTAAEVVPHYVARYWDLMALAAKQPAKVIGADAILRDRPGFEVEFLTRGSIPEEPYATDRHEVLMPVRGHWRLAWDGGETVLNPGDTCAVPLGLSRSLAPSMTGEASLYRVRNTDDPAGPTRRG